MIVTKTTGVCDRCKKEVDKDFYKITVETQNIISSSYASGYMSNFYVGDGIRMPGSDAYHLCQDCLNEFRKFARNE
jgi:hypothetical protein